MSGPVTLATHGGMAVLRIDNPPVNALSQAVIDGLAAALDAFEADAAAKALVIVCAGRTFVAGGDITQFDDPGFSARPFNRVLARIEQQDRPVVAAMHGTVLGGGLELALACHFRVAQQGTRFGFPEVKLGLLPGSLGTQRLPRLVGVQLALDLISSGRSLSLAQALQAGIVDHAFEGDPQDQGLSHARDLLARAVPLRRLSAESVPAGSVPDGFFASQAEQALREKPAYPAAAAIVRAIEASMQPFAQGEQVEAELFEALRASPQSRALRHLFFAQRQAGRIPGLPAGLALRRIARVGVLGAGTMGRGIAMNFLNAGMSTVLVASRALYDASAAKGRMTPDQVERRMALLEVSDADLALAGCDLVIEAVYEDLALKQQVCGRLGEICKPGAIIATNTSTLDVDLLAQACGRAGDFVGMHFFSPANVMRLLEVVRGARTAPEVLATVMQVARTIDKVAVVSGVCYGFIGNRMAEVYMREAEFLVMEGASPAEVDAAVEAFGMAMGPCRMLDMAGVDVGARTVIEYGKAGGLPPDPSYRALVRKLYALGRHGQKTGAGYYRYQGRQALPDPETERIAAELAAEHGIVRRSGIGPGEIVERLLYPMVNEAARILEEGIAYRPGDIDVVWTAGYGFPDHQGGPLFMADRIGLPEVVRALSRHGQARGNRFGYWTIAPLLGQLAEQGRRISEWRPAGRAAAD
jgi:3-hydroxyacyl-CoA dehydrogenase